MSLTHDKIILNRGGRPIKLPGFEVESAQLNTDWWL